MLAEPGVRYHLRGNSRFGFAVCLATSRYLFVKSALFAWTQDSSGPIDEQLYQHEQRLEKTDGQQVRTFNDNQPTAWPQDTLYLCDSIWIVNVLGWESTDDCIKRIIIDREMLSNPLNDPCRLTDLPPSQCSTCCCQHLW